MADIHLAQRGGAREMVLTGVHLASWGHDFTPPFTWLIWWEPFCKKGNRTPASVFA
jgi:hypothetical protein